MRRIFNNPTAWLAALALGFAPAALFAQDAAKTTETTQTTTTVRTDDPAAATPDFSRLTDAEFLQRAAISGMMEVASSKTVDGKVENQAVEQFAERMIDDHNRANRDLVSLAESKGIDLDRTLDDRRQAALDRMGELDAATLEREYMKMQVAAHRESVALFSAMAERARDAEIKAFAQKQVPILRQHLQMAERLAGATAGADTTTTTVPPRDR